MISANGVEYKNLPEQVQYLTERAAEFAVELDRVSASIESVAGDVAALQTSYTTLAEDVRVAKININTLFVNFGTAFTEITNIKNGTTHLFDTITDSQGNKRFVEGNISLSSEIAKDFNLEYGKWSLSGTHLMIVLAVKCTADNIKYAGAWFNNGTSLPNYIFDKIKTSSVVVAGVTRDLVSINQPLTIRNSDIINGPKFYLQKSYGRFQIISFDSFTYSIDDYLRIQFDLLIDAS